MMGFEAGELLYLPPGYPGDFPAAANMVDACVKSYPTSDLSGLTGDQAHRLLCFRDFARAAVLRYGPTLRYVESVEPAEVVAIFISRRRELAEGVVAMMDERFDSGADPDDLPRDIALFEYFDDIDAACEEILEDWEGPAREWREP